MNYLIIGDIHGCYHTFLKLLDENWDSEKEKLIILGDFVNKGKHTFAVIELLLKLQKKHKQQIIILKGNNEFLFANHFLDSINLATKQKFEHYNLNYMQTLNWMKELPHFYENEVFFASHAGISEGKILPLEPQDESVLFNRKPLQNIGKIQFIGHVVVDEVQYDENSSAYYVDTGAGFGMKLSGIKWNDLNQLNKIISLKINEKDKFN